MSRPANLLRHFGGMAERHGIAIMAPDFSGPAWRGFQRLAADGAPDRSAQRLELAARDLAGRLGLDDGRFDLAGYSAGAQFAHRFAMSRPERVRSLLIGAAGWYTEADLSLPYPEGLGGIADPARVAAFLRLPIVIAVGGADRQSDTSLRRSPELDQRQGRNRLERARFWTAHLLQRAAELGIEPRVTLAELAGTGHSLSEAVKLGRLDRLLADHILDPAIACGGPPPIGTLPVPDCTATRMPQCTDREILP
ncbi:MAG: hypothetical protein U1E37_04730 [Sphingomonadaceae bacterium]